MKQTACIMLSIITLGLSGLFFEKYENFNSAQESLQNRSIPSPLLNFGKRGLIMGKLGLDYVVPDDKASEDEKLFALIKIGQSGLKKKESWLSPGEINLKNLPSSKIVDNKHIDKDIPLISIYVNKNDLYNHVTGIFTNYNKKGRGWERPCYFTYYKRGEITTGTAAGIRLHGSGHYSKRKRSIRIYLRNIYDSDNKVITAIFPEKKLQTDSFILAKEGGDDFFFLNSIAMDISQITGCETVRTKPVQVLLNGHIHTSQNSPGIFTITDYINKTFIHNKYNLKKFIMVRIKKHDRLPTPYINLINWANNRSDPMLMKTAKKKIDIINFTKFWIANIFLANTDPFQGVAVLDLDKTKRWFWINWDMDHSIRNRYDYEKPIKIWEQSKLLEQLTKGINLPYFDPRGLIFYRLMKEDPQYRKYFISEFNKVIDKRITAKFLNKTQKHYREITQNFNLNETDFIDRITVFFRFRREFIKIKINKVYQQIYNTGLQK